MNVYRNIPALQELLMLFRYHRVLALTTKHQESRLISFLLSCSFLAMSLSACGGDAAPTGSSSGSSDPPPSTAAVVCSNFIKEFDANKQTMTDAQFSDYVGGVSGKT